MKVSVKKIAALVLALVMVAVVFTACGSSKSVKVEDYFVEDVEFAGSNGNGFIVFGEVGEKIYDMEALYNAMTDGKSADTDEAFAILACVTVEPAENNESLKNGDTIEVKVTVNADQLNQMEGVTKPIKGKTEVTKKYKVKGLE